MKHAKAIELIATLIEENKLDVADEMLEAILKDDPNHAGALCQMTLVLLRWPRVTLAYQCGKRATEVGPNMRAAWINFGFAAQDLWRHAEAKRAYLRALELSKEPQDVVKMLSNLSSWCVDLGNFEEGKKYARQALEIDPEHQKSLCNLGFCELGTRVWDPGWKHYRYALYQDARKMVQYGDEPEWDGSAGKNVVLYGEQGLGDELSFASMVPDAAKDCKKLIIECHPKLETIFRRSFPQTKVYGTRKEKYLGWLKEDRDIDASLAIGQLGEYYRTTDESFPGTPFLTPDPDKVLMWKALFATKKKPTIGIAWRGGIAKTGARYRKWGLDELLPIFQAVDAHWVSLQYRPSKKEIERFNRNYPDIEIHEYPQATLTEDYDDTAALVASVDMVICIQTAVAHLAGALGTPVWVFVPQNTQWRYGNKGDSIPWYNSLRVVRQARQGVWDGDIRRIAKELRLKYRRRKVA